ncbi:MAG: NADPH:quinone reductase [Acidimicrobiaceae bacterium]|nr:NADPH:quinone reductase [Acidimicrobiaceae bacterium]
MHAIQISEHGSADVMGWVELDAPTARTGQVVVELGAAGLNFIDTYQRSGLYKVPLPYVLGLEGAGTVVEVGDGVDHLAVGDRVAWAAAPGSYAERVAVPAAQAMPVPDGIGWDVAAAIPLQGMTAHYLAVDTYPLGQGDACLIHAGAGGVGLLLIQIAKLRGAEVYTTVGTPEKAELATAAGADHTILNRDVDFVDAIRDIAGSERPLDVVYDGVGKSVFTPSLGLIRPRGMMVTFGNASGPVDPVSPLDLSANGSIFLTRPTLGHYTSSPDELRRRADDLFGWHADGSLDVRIGQRFALADAADAHRALEGRATTGKVVLVP